MSNQVLDSTYLTTHDQLPPKDFHTPFSGDGMKRIRGHVGRIRSHQAVAATLAHDKYVAEHEGRVLKLLVAVGDLAAAGETMTYDVQVNGVSIMSKTPEITNATAVDGLFDVMSLLATAVTLINVGDVIDIQRTYAAGGGPTPLTGNDVILEWG